MAARLLDQARVPFVEIDVSGDRERRRWLAQVTGRRTVPQIFVDGRCIGGYEEVAALLRRGELQRLMENQSHG
jgi:glutaredoxin 3